MSVLPDSSILSITTEDIENYGILVGKNIIVVIPAYNEERFIGSTVLKVKKYSEEVIVVDDGSDDDTAEIAIKAGALVVRHPENRGKGEALNTGFLKAIEFTPDVVVAIDADGQHVPSELPILVSPIFNGEADLVVGSRYLDDNSVVPKHRMWGHRFFSLFTHLVSGTRVTDSQSGYRAFSPKALEMISFNSTGFSVESEMQFIAKEYGLKVKEVPITIHYKDAPKRSVWRHGLNVLNGILRLIGQYRPLYFFGLPGLFIMLFGIGWGLYVVDIFYRTQTLAVGYAMISVLMTVIGLLGLSTGIILHSVRGLLIDLIGQKREK